jgi:hypothetical protein
MLKNKQTLPNLPKSTLIQSVFCLILSFILRGPFQLLFAISQINIASLHLNKIIIRNAFLHFTERVKSC